MNKYKFLSFFNKNGNDLNLKYNEGGFWTGKIHLSEVSTFLFESENIYILEEFKTSDNIEKYGIPKYSTETDQETGGPLWTASWESNIVDEIFLYQVDTNNNEPIIEVIDNLDIEVDTISTSDSISDDNQVITDNINESNLQLNIAIKSENEGVFQRKLIIKEKDTKYIIAKIDVYGEVIGEDERLPQNLYKLGSSINLDEFNIFRDSDINEDLPDFLLLNRKRVELLAENRNILPYLGAYKGLINIIKFYGYDNISIKEYWVNIDKNSKYYGKYKATPTIDVFNQNVNFNDPNVNLPNKSYKKTSLFSLNYRINQLTGELDKYDMPVTEETSQFTLEEVLIKLYGLKQILMRKWLIGNARIIDITGEADYFNHTTNTVWVNENRIDKFDIGIDPCFKSITDTTGYIKDLRTIEELTFPGFTPYLINPDLYADSEIITEDIEDVLIGYFTNYAPALDSINKLPDKPGIPVGYPIVLENCSFDLTWDEAQMNWNELLGTGSVIFDFRPDNIGNQDLFIIRDSVSNEQVSYVADFSDTIEDVVNQLYILIEAQLNDGDGLPWSYYSITKEDTDDDGNYDTIRFRQIFSANINTNFKGETINNNLQQSPGPVINKFLVTGNTLNTWDSIGIGNFYELEWNITKEEDETPEYNFSVRGDIGEFNKLIKVLPYSGKYTVELKLFDTFNQVSSDIKRDFITVLNKNVEFIGFYKAIEKNITFNNTDFTWDSYTSYWDLPIKPEEYLWEGHASMYESLDRANYILNNSNPDHALSYHYENLGIPLDNTLYTPGAYFWDNLDNSTWNDAYHIWWDSTKVSGDTPANFRINSIELGESITIINSNGNIGTHEFNTSDLQEGVSELNLSSNPIISKFIYNPVYNITTSGTEVVFIQAVAKFTSKSLDWNEITSTGNIELSNLQLTEINNPTWNEIKFIEDGKILPKLTYITFTYDKSLIPGKNNPVWRIINTDDMENNDIYFTGRWLTYLFKKAGRYSIELTLVDSNGNMSTLNKNIVIIK